MLIIRSYGITDTGLLRTHNEDCFGLDDANQVYTVADGMGGHNFGEVASQMAVDSIRQFLAQCGAGPVPPGFDAAGLLRRSVEGAQEKVLAAIAADAELLGMGSTIVSAMLHERMLSIAHVGDSRCYRERGGVLELLTTDHTWVAEMVTQGLFTEAEAKAHPLSSVVTRAIGGEAAFEVEITVAEARPGDLFLLCSDGLNSMLSDAEIEARMAGGDLAEIGRVMIADANGRGGFDNTTVVLLRVEERSEEARSECADAEPWRSAALPPGPVPGGAGGQRRAGRL